MAILRTALVMFVLSAVLVALAVLRRVVAGDSIEVGNEALPVLTLAIWAILFLAFIAFNAVLNAPVPRQARREGPTRGESHGQRERIKRRLIIVVAAVCLTVTNLAADYLGDELTSWGVLLGVGVAAALTMVAIVIADLVLSQRKPSRSH